MRGVRGELWEGRRREKWDWDGGMGIRGGT